MSVVAPAVQSVDAELGSYGGAILLSPRAFESHSVLTDENRHGAIVRSTHANLVARTLPLRGTEVTVFGCYARGGVYRHHLLAIAKMTGGGPDPS